MAESKKVTVSKRDVIWNYVGTIASMGSNFLLLPLLLSFLSSAQIGLWYVFVAISGFAQLLEFGFTSTLSRNILYCLSGAKKLTKQGCDYSSVDGEVDWHLMRVVLDTSKTIYAVLGLIALFVAATLGTFYVSYVTDSFLIEGSLPAWIVFVVSIFTNLYFLYCLTFLRGLGDVAGENRAKTLARIGQLAITAVLLFCGLSLLAAALGFLAYSTLLRLFAIRTFRSHHDVEEGIKSDAAAVAKDEMLDVLKTVSFVAWRDGVVSLAWYGATQATSLLCSAFLGLEQTGTYSVMLQFATAIHQISSAYLRSCFPTFQSAYVRDDKQTQKAVVERGISCYVCMYIVATVLVTACLPILTLFKHDFICDPVLFLGIALYYFLLNQHSLFCNIIVSMNEIPYFKAYLVSTAAGICVSCVLCGALGWGAWGLVVGRQFHSSVTTIGIGHNMFLNVLGLDMCSPSTAVLFGGKKEWLGKEPNCRIYFRMVPYNFLRKLTIAWRNTARALSSDF